MSVLTNTHSFHESEKRNAYSLIVILMTRQTGQQIYKWLYPSISQIIILGNGKSTRKILQFMKEWLNSSQIFWAGTRKWKPSKDGQAETTRRGTGVTILAVVKPQCCKSVDAT